MERTASQDSQDRSFATMGILLSSNSAITAVLNPFGSILHVQTRSRDNTEVVRKNKQEAGLTERLVNMKIVTVDREVEM